MKEEKPGFKLRWPWNLALCVIVALVLGYWAGYLWSILLVAVFLSCQKKLRKGAPEVGYCMDRTRKRLSHLGLAALLLFFAAAVGVYSWSQTQADRTLWDYMEYAKWIVGWLAALGFAAGGIYTGYTSIRDAFWPEKSTLAKSIRSQLPYPEEAKDVKELFAMVDRDIEENGQWFDKVAVGKEWVLGDEASYIPRIRVVFGRDEIRYHNSSNGSTAARIVELYILDDRRQVQMTSLRNPNELTLLLDCIRLRAPDALVRPYSEYAGWRSKSEEEWTKALLDYRRRQGERETLAFQSGPKETQNIILTRSDGSVTSRVTPKLIHQILEEGLEQEGDLILLTSTRPLESQGRSFRELECEINTWGECEEETGEGTDSSVEDEAEVFLMLKEAPSQSGGSLENGFVLYTDMARAEKILCDWLLGKVPDLKLWESVQYQAPQSAQSKGRELPPPHLGLMSAQGVFQSHNTFTKEDVQVAAEGLADGTYQMVDLTLPGGYLWFRAAAGDKTDGRCSVFATRADADMLRYFKTKCTQRQAAAWLTEYAEGSFRPGGSDWKDYTRQMQKSYAREAKKSSK